MAALSKTAAYFGFVPPYRFERAIPAFLAIVALIAVAVAASWLRAHDQLILGGPRALYFLYLALLLGAALACLRWPKLSVPLVILAIVDLVWGLGASASLLPPLKHEPQRFQWHALLQIVPIPSLQVMSSTGLQISHTSEGTRGREPAPGSIEGRTVVATYGGSTGYDIGVGEGDTWSDRLADALGRDRYFVVNNGVPGYTTVEHLMQTAFYQTKFGRQPRCAVYYVGWNDLRNAHIPHLDPGYADFHLPSQVDSLRVRRVGGSNVTISPTLTVLARILSANVDTIRYGSDPYALAPQAGEDPVVTDLFRRNVRSISAINRQRGVATIWVGQLVNPAALQGEGLYGWLPLVRDRDVWPLLQRLNAALAEAAAVAGDRFVDIPPKSFAPSDFVDNGHFSVQGARRFAEAVAPAVREACH